MLRAGSPCAHSTRARSHVTHARLLRDRAPLVGAGRGQRGHAAQQLLQRRARLRRRRRLQRALVDEP